MLCASVQRRRALKASGGHGLFVTGRQEAAHRIGLELELVATARILDDVIYRRN